ncbi:MAG: serine hydrolase, partial [Nevskiales bacterium]
MMYAASLPKIAILFGAFQKAYEGRLRLDSGMREQMIDMIRFSSNEAATYVLNKVGRSYLAGLLQSRKYRFYDANLNGGLWVGKAYASGGAYRRDPLHNISHGATAYQVARFYYMMETGRLVSPEYSRQMKEMMGDPGIHHKFVKGLEETHPDARIYRKSGTWREYHADSAIIERAGRRYIAVALAEHPRGGEWMKDLIVAMDNIVFSRPRPIQAASLN